MAKKQSAASLVGILALGAIALSTLPVQAGPLDGSTATFQYYAYGAAYGGSSSFLVPGNTSFLSYFTVSVAGNHITYDYDSDVTWSPSVASLNSNGLYLDNGSLISFSGAPAITSVTIDPSSELGISGFDAGDVTFNSDAVAATWMNLDFAEGNTVVLDVNTGTSSVPEPLTLSLFGAGLAGATALRRRKTKAW